MQIHLKWSYLWASHCKHLFCSDMVASTLLLTWYSILGFYTTEWVLCCHTKKTIHMYISGSEVGIFSGNFYQWRFLP
jgi:hypothetical protein